MKPSRNFDFPVSVAWVDGRLVRASVSGKETIEIATPPEFKGTDEGVWSPEDFLVAAAASCFAVTYLAVAEQRAIPVHELSVAGVGRMGMDPDNRLGFVGIDLTATLATEPGQEAAAAVAAARAERGCFVSRALSVPVRLETVVRAVAPA